MDRTFLDIQATARKICALDNQAVAEFIWQLRQDRKLTTLVHALNEAAYESRPDARAALDHLGFV
ncbi:hypothetical protein ABEB22_09790 [Thioclava sp. 'Guangxiensis']|uniref:hypothetical protein n=1 Tax=Thioclava sp. 'Guangxiensis' TaxID=3149044 RepID=UPI0038783944